MKSERTEENVYEELEAYTQEINKYRKDDKSEEIDSFIDKLYDINGQMWDTEGDIRSGANLPLEEIGRLAIKCRDINCVRNGVKAEIVEMFAEGFKEIAINYQKVDYGKPK